MSRSAARRRRAAAEPTSHHHDPALASAARPTLSLIKAARPLPHRAPLAPHTLPALAAARAALAARAARIHVPVMAWNGHHDGAATAQLPDGTHLHHPAGTTTAFTAVTPCPLGAGHIHTVTGPADLHDARTLSAACTTLHADLAGWATTAARDLTNAFATHHDPASTPVMPLHQKGDGR